MDYNTLCTLFIVHTLFPSITLAIAVFLIQMDKKCTPIRDKKTKNPYK